MKNLFILPSDNYKNTKLSLFQNKLYLGDVASTALPQNIYIISDEEIKDGYVINTFNNTVYRIVPDNSSREILSEPTNIPLCVVNKEHYFKIILTTDPDLIKDGVQPIPDEFLEWLSENQTCERLDIEQNWEGNGVMFGFKMGGVSPDGDIKYKIIPPKEPKITLELTQQEARGLLNCLMRTSANGKDLDVGEMVEEKLWEFLKPLESK